jgi:hypothetical protein
MLSPELRKLLMEGPPSPADKANHLVRFGGSASLLVTWRRHRDELLEACPPGRRPWAFWMLERRLKQRPAGEAGELRTIRTLNCYRDNAERELVCRRLAAITEELHAPPAPPPRRLSHNKNICSRHSACLQSSRARRAVQNASPGRFRSRRFTQSTRARGPC